MRSTPSSLAAMLTRPLSSSDFNNGHLLESLSHTTRRYKCLEPKIAEMSPAISTPCCSLCLQTSPLSSVC